jgi:hypothetical protein
MTYEKISLREVYSSRLKEIMGGAMSTYTTYDGHQLSGDETRFGGGNLIIKPREIDLND